MRRRRQYAHGDEHHQLGHIRRLPNEKSRNGNQRHRHCIGVKHQRHRPVIARRDIDQHGGQRHQKRMPQSRRRAETEIQPGIAASRAQHNQHADKTDPGRNGAARPHRLGQNKRRQRHQKQIARKADGLGVGQRQGDNGVKTQKHRQ